MSLTCISEPQIEPEGSENQVLIDEIAQAVSRRGLIMPAVCLLEMHRPLAGLLHFAVELGMPLLSLFCGASLARGFEKLLRSPAAVDQLINRLECLSSSR